MSRPSIRRDPTPSERSQPWAIAAGTISFVLLVAAIIGIRVLASPSVLFWFIVFMGVLALALVTAAAFYSARKRLFQERFGGTMMAWLKSHIYLGGAALVAALAHSFLFSWGGGLTSGKVAIFLLVLLVASGVAWRIVYLRVPPKVPADVGNRSIGDTRSRGEDLGIELEKARVGKSAGFQRSVDELLAGRHPGELRQVAATFSQEEQPAWARVEDLAHRLHAEAQREEKQQRYSRLLQGWRALHLPLGLLLLVAVLFHLWSVFNLGRLFENDADKQFASAGDCASCHSEIVDEWKLSAHRNAQTSTITVAQTTAALQANPEFEKACVNCHAPIGSRFSGSTTFPVLDDPGLSPSGASEEGITCVVCHTMEEHPEELAGFQEDAVLPVGERGSLTLGKMFGPPLDGSEAQSNPAHEVATGFMTDPVGSSQLCGACHNVVVDVDQNGLGAAGDDAAPADSDDDGELDENEIDKQNDLVLQTTFNEWEDFIFSGGGFGASCVDCHMPAETSPAADGPPLRPAPERSRNAHTFVGIDYELNTDYYSQPGMPPEALERVLEEREELLSGAVELNMDIPPARNGVLTASVNLRNLTGHSFPTGFAFARQWWLEVTAQTSSGRPVCLVAVQGVGSTCGSGVLASPTEELKTCDVQPIAEGDVNVELIAAAPPDNCDPWLVNFQKILTDGDPDGDGVFQEVAFQSLAGGVVRNRVRAVPDPLSNKVQVMNEIRHGKTRKFTYQFDVSDVGEESISVRVVLHLRHLPPYFVRELEPFLPDDVTSSDLLENMTIVDVASNKPLAESRTFPAPEELASRATRDVAAAGATTEAPWALAPLVGIVLVAPVVARRRRRKDATPGA